MTQVVVGAAFTAIAAGFAVGLIAVFLTSRDIDTQLTSGDIVTLVAGAACGGAAFALIGLAVGTLVRNQVPAVVGMLLWILFIESLLRAGIPSLAKFAPGSLARAVAGQTVAALESAIAAGTTLAVLTVVVLVAASAAFSRRDIP
jgi:ABC-type transport system involved in multi-copper enzyme maturation permease subunit